LPHCENGPSVREDLTTYTKSTYYSHELNLILNDRSCINVVDHGNRERLRGDASTLS